eukprot:CAMPEP_0172308436 /NCGR_PEP_ID=MMETSP1058-20130122/9027_1 /TAXON_ID=83371 /ORGANISM="Detonula confervacea, Strain CCMP 353" /LENGTH=530 /DNA_ID=CAMNT_0013020851 /DNA_START=138 /DNA_END=1726 /DNA_ORIENTATION=+
MKNYQSITIKDEVPTSNFTPIITTDDDAHPEDHLVPPFDSDERPSNLFVGSFNLIATIIGGAVLSLPIVFQKCGIAFTTLAMMLSAYMTYMSLVMLCFCSRRGGGSSFGEVVRSAFGERAEEGVSWLIFVFLMFVITGYMVLIRDIWTPLVREVFGMDVDSDHILLAIVGLLLPFLFQRSLYALRFNCYVGSASIFVLCIALCRGGWQRITSQSISDEHNDGGFDIEFFKIPSAQDIMFSFPIVTCAFLCQFNIISIQNALRRPTRKRTQNLVQYAVGGSFLIMYMFGLGGYLYAGSRTEGNILLNVPMARQAGEDEGEYYLFLLGRIGCGITIMFAMPMMALPCREALLEVVDVWFHHSHHIRDETAEVPTTGEETCCWKLFHRCNKSETDQDADITTEDEFKEILPEGLDDENQIHISSVLIRHDPIQSDYIFRNTFAHYGSTLLITITCYLGAVAVSGVAVVWSFIGSSMGICIGFILPCGCFVVIESVVPTVARGGDRQCKWLRIAWAILVFSIVGATVCTINSIA